MHMEDHVICLIFHHNMTVHLMIGTIMEVGVAKSKGTLSNNAVCKPLLSHLWDGIGRHALSYQR